MQAILKYDSSYRPDEDASCAMQPEGAGSAGLGIPSRLRKKSPAAKHASTLATPPSTAPSADSSRRRTAPTVSFNSPASLNWPSSNLEKDSATRRASATMSFNSPASLNWPSSQLGQSGKLISLQQAAAPGSSRVSRTSSGTQNVMSLDAGAGSDVLAEDMAAALARITSGRVSRIGSGIGGIAGSGSHDALAEDVAAATAALARLGSGRVSRTGSGIASAAAAAEYTATDAMLASIRSSVAGESAAAEELQAALLSGADAAIGGGANVALAEQHGEAAEEPARYTLSKLPSIPEQASMEELAGIPSNRTSVPGSAIRVA